MRNVGYRFLNEGNVMKIALYVAALCSMILFNSPVLAAGVQEDLNGSGVSSGPGAGLYQGPRSPARDPSIHSPGQYTSPSGPGAGLYQGPRSLVCDPTLKKNQVGQTIKQPVKPELPMFHRPLYEVP